MPKSLPSPPPGFDELSVEEQFDYVQSLWDRIVANPDEISVPSWHQAVIEESLAAHRAHPKEARPCDEVRTEVAEKLKDFRSRRE
ncbi:MAG TPA: addiction module protein [Thermoanaerobaculia bacterium]|nr:addiction module protein [Thermoanaerobaculia bacterium]